MRTLELADIIERGAEHYGAFPDTTESVVRAVFGRDLNACHFCGFTSRRYQHVGRIGGHDRDIDHLVTLCPYCWQCFDLQGCGWRRSGVLIHFPEIAQTELNALTREIYVLMIAQGLKAQAAQAAFDYLNARRQVVVDGMGSDQPWVESGQDMRQLLRATDRHFLAGLRLWPRDRWIAKDGTVEFNMFPQMLAFWRSQSGPFARAYGLLTDQTSSIVSFLRRFCPEWARDHLDTGGQRMMEEKTHAELAEKLLRDGAAFFRTVAEQNPPVREQMSENASVFEQVADLLRSDPMGRIGGAAGASSNGDQAPGADSQPSHAELAAKLLRDAATFFQSIADQNPALTEQMDENADVFRQVADLVQNNPLGIVEG